MAKTAATTGKSNRMTNGSGGAATATRSRASTANGEWPAGTRGKGATPPNGSMRPAAGKTISASAAPQKRARNTTAASSRNRTG